jgi:transcriptional regulator, tetR family
MDDMSVRTDNAETPSTEERILEAAVREFMAKGYAGARTAAIAEAAGVTHAMLHYYFRTKDKLFDRIIESKIVTLRDIMLASLGDPSVPLFDKIRTAIEKHQDFIAANPDLPRFMINEVLSRPERIPMVIEQLKRHTPLVVESLQRQIDEYAAKGLCRKVDAGMLMLDIVSLNIFPFTAKPMVNALLGGMMEDMEAFVEARKKENLETIMRKIRP